MRIEDGLSTYKPLSGALDVTSMTQALFDYNKDEKIDARDAFVELTEKTKPVQKQVRTADAVEIEITLPKTKKAESPVVENTATEQPREKTTAVVAKLDVIV